ncbi:hypothetical protein ACI8AA_01405 [Geodermatophilus sp. SYSU D01180]
MPRDRGAVTLPVLTAPNAPRARSPNHERRQQQGGEMAVDAQYESAYRVLVGHRRTDGTTKSTRQLHTEYIRLVDELVRRMTAPEVAATDPPHFDFVIWLDKSARPIAWLTRALWPLLATDVDGTTPPMPQFRFVNIDRNQWATSVDPEGRGTTHVERLDPSIFRSLRSIFLRHPADREEGLTVRVDRAPATLDGRRLLIVDEVQSSGRTLDYAQRFFRKAFHDVHVEGAHWMGGLTTRGTATGNADIPVWYSDTTVLGRGVGNRNIDASLKSPHPTQRLGAWFLSTRLPTPDPLSARLRLEIRQLAADARAGNVLIEPSPRRPEEDYDERVHRLNGLTIKEFIDRKRLL